MKRDLFVTILFLGAVLSARANAYLDAGTGSYVIQMVIAGALGGMLTLKTYWRLIKAKLTNRS